MSIATMKFLAADGLKFLSEVGEDSTPNQYWYSSKNIRAMADDLQAQGLLCVNSGKMGWEGRCQRPAVRSDFALLIAAQNQNNFFSSLSPLKICVAGSAKTPPVTIPIPSKYYKLDL